MTLSSERRGGAPVGFVTELDPVEAGAVLYLRLWCEGEETRLQMSQDLTTALGPERGDQALKSFAAICDLCVRHGRRPLMRHHVTCKCLGADESCFANFLGYASDGDKEDALLIATTLVAPNVAPLLVGLAEEFAMALKQMAVRADRAYASGVTLH